MSGTIIDWLQSGAIDIGTVYNTSQFGPLDAQPFFTEQLFVARAWSEKLSAVPVITGAELARLPLALPHPNHGLRWLLSQKIERHNLDLDVRFEVDSVHAIKQLILNTGVASILPYGAMAMEIENCAISATPLVKPIIHRTMAMATASNNMERSTKLIAAC
jgi:LysR family nitrogen assimilation transcriptional regulator